VPTGARALVHEWDVKEVFSNEAGNIQYIELFTNTAGQTDIGGHEVRVIADGVTSEFTIPANLSAAPAGSHLLFATAEFAELGIVTPDYVLPCGRFFDPNAASIRIEFDTYDSIMITGTLLPGDGTQSVQDNNAAMVGTSNPTAQGASPTNLAGQSSNAVDVSGCLNDGTCSPCEDEDFCNGAEVCSGSACGAAVNTDPCGALDCDETTDMCVCASDPDCDDGNECTDDSCNAGVCSNPFNTADCDDGMFCTSTDACSGGTCVGSGDACPGEQCNEIGGFCGACADDGQCDDGEFCNGEEACNAGTCELGAPACAIATESCDEATDACIALCGDGDIDGTEACDDGDDDAGDGCSATCTVEGGFTCDSAEPSVCTRIPDAGTHDHDAGATVDAGGGVDAGMAEEDGGCGCRASSSSGSGTLALFALLGLAFVLRRRAA
jgi:MYXO-CTERM domain-containing protein